MNLSHLVVLIIRLIAVCLCIYALQSSVYSFVMFLASDFISIANIAFNISTLIAGLLLWFFPYTAAKFLTRSEEFEKPAPTTISSEQFSAIIFIALGLYLSFNVISDAGYWIFFIQNRESFEIHTELTLDNRASIFATVLEAIFVILLLFGRKKLVQFFLRLRQ